MSKKLFLFLFLFITSPTSFNALATPQEDPVFHLKEILGDYPELGSYESNQDFETLLYFQNNRTEADCAAAAKEVNGTLKNLFGGLLTPKELKRVSNRMNRATILSGFDHWIAKMIYKRPRPFNTNPEIKPCIKLPKSKSYPSGHSTISRAYARVLSVMYPDRAEAFMARADEIAMHRVLGGVHHPSDTEAGKRLGDAIARFILKTNSF